MNKLAYILSFSLPVCAGCSWDGLDVVENGEKCSVDSDCASKNCVSSICRDKSYQKDDGNSGGNEKPNDSNVPLGGSCSRNVDCQSGNCVNRVCRPMP